MRQSVFLTIAVLLYAGILTYSQGNEGQISIMFYNLENMFHPSDDSISGDDEFTPEGIRRWSYYRYHQKLAQISKVFLAANNWDTPDIIALCELENRMVLEDLVNHPLLLKYDYSILHRDSPDHRGMDVAVLYRNQNIDFIDTTWIKAKNEKGQMLNSREIILVKFLINKDTLLFSMNHWTSKYGGEVETESKRKGLAIQLGQHLDSAQKSQVNLLIVAGGDFNEASSAASIKLLLEQSKLSEIAEENDFHSYKYQGKWESLDHVFVGGNLGPEKCNLQVLYRPFLLEEDVQYAGMMPYRTYRGYKFNGGISDHLPLILKFKSLSSLMD